jgi:hypothetical protein
MEQAPTGGCACGSVRYRLNAAPFDAGWCHCRVCQLISGSPAIVFATVPTDHLVFTGGRDQVKSYASSSFGHRLFCGECGTLLAMKVDHQPKTIDITVATLDDPGEATPGFHIFCRSKIGWFETRDNLPRHDQFRPDTVGLQGTEPPA